MRKYVDKMIQLAKDGSLHARRQVCAQARALEALFMSYSSSPGCSLASGPCFCDIQHIEQEVTASVCHLALVPHACMFSRHTDRSP